MAFFAFRYFFWFTLVRFNLISVVEYFFDFFIAQLIYFLLFNLIFDAIVSIDVDKGEKKKTATVERKYSTKAKVMRTKPTNIV